MIQRLQRALAITTLLLTRDPQEAICAIRAEHSGLHDERVVDRTVRARCDDQQGALQPGDAVFVAFPADHLFEVTYAASSDRGGSRLATSDLGRPHRSADGCAPAAPV